MAKEKGQRDKLKLFTENQIQATWTPLNFGWAQVNMFRGWEGLGKAHFGKTYHIRQIAEKTDSCDFFVCPFPHNFFGSSWSKYW